MQEQNSGTSAHDDHKDQDKQLHIFVNRIKFDRSQGVKKKMSVDEIARLADLTAETAVVRRVHGNSGNVGDPLEGDVEIKNGDQFFVTRRMVEGGYSDRIQNEIGKLLEAGQGVELVLGPASFVLYRGLYTPFHPDLVTDAVVAVPNGYPAAFLDRVALPVGSPLIGLLKGAPQENVLVSGRQFQMISYHPHTNGGGKPWDPNRHGFHTYFSEILAWLAVRK